MKQTEYKTIEQVEAILLNKGWEKSDELLRGDYFKEKHLDLNNLYLWTHPTNYKLSGGIFLIEKEDKIYIKGVLTNCMIECCGLDLEEVEFSLRNLKKLIDTGIYNYGKGKRSY